MKKTRLVSAAISVSLSGLLLSGVQQAQDFAYYLCLAMNILAWLCCWSAARLDTAKTMVEGVWLSLPLTALSIYALASTGSPKLAASQFLLAFVILAISYSVLQVKEKAE